MIDQRKILMITTVVLSAVGILMLLYVFSSTLKPNVSKVSKNVSSIDISTIKPGEHKEFELPLGYIVVLRLSEQQKVDLVSVNSLVHGPDLTVDTAPNMFVYRPVGKFGCTLSHISSTDKYMDYVDFKWPGGWIDPCHAGAWDYAGRAFKEVNVPIDYVLENLKSPKYKLDKNFVVFFPINIE